MHGAWSVKAKIMIGGNGVNHIDVCSGDFGKSQRVLYHHVGVSYVVCHVEIVVARKDVLLYEFHKVEAGS